MTPRPISTEILAWMREHPRADGYTLDDLSRQFNYSRERMRDHLRRLVDEGSLSQSERVSGFADSNPVYTLPGEASP